jgi:DNA-binding beta-propeller fold protein YncE
VLAQQPYHVIAHWKIGGDSRWDYVHIDSATQRLYVSHGNRVEVLDAKTGQSVGAIDGLTGSHGIAIDGTGKFGYISDSGGGVVIFDTKTFAKVKSIPTKFSADGIVYEPLTKTVWTFTGRGGNADATAIDTVKQELVATIPITEDRFEAETADGKGHVFSDQNDNIVRIDAKTKKVDATWPTGCNHASGLAYDTKQDRIFQTCNGNKMFIVDAKTGKVLGSAEIGDGPDGAGFNAKGDLAFAPTGDGFVTVVDAKAAGYPDVEKIPTAPGARTMDYDPTTDRIYTMSGQVDPSAPASPRPQYLPDTFNVIVIGR